MVVALCAVGRNGTNPDKIEERDDHWLSQRVRCISERPLRSSGRRRGRDAENPVAKRANKNGRCQGRECDHWQQCLTSLRSHGHHGDRRIGLTVCSVTGGSASFSLWWGLPSAVYRLSSTGLTVHDWVAKIERWQIGGRFIVSCAYKERVGASGETA